MTLRAFVGDEQTWEVDANSNLVMTFLLYVMGPEIIVRFGGDPNRKVWQDFVSITVDGTETLAQLGTKLTDAVVANIQNQLQLTIVRTNIYLPSYTKGI